MKKKDILIIFVSIIIFCVNTISISNNSVRYNGNSKVLTPVIVLNQDEMIDKQVEQNSFPIGYNFSIDNYNDKTVNEVDFEYVIEIESSVENFPVKCFLYDLDKRIQLDVNNCKSSPIKLDKFKKVSRKFKLIVEWKELEGELAEELEIKLKVKAVQKEKEEIFEI